MTTAGPDEPATVAISGASGLVGTALTRALASAGHGVVRLVRRDPRGERERRWEPHAPAVDLLDGVDAVVHLAGASLFGRFTRAHKRAVRASRVGPTTELARVAARARPGPRAFVSASAVGYYGNDRGDEVLTEESRRGEGFIAETVAAWEAATLPAAEVGVRVVNVRTGVVQSPKGGPLRIYLPLFRLGLGFRVGDGSQLLPWIDLDDLVGVYQLALREARLSGPVNAVAPEVVSGAEYTRTLARVLNRPAPFVVPRFATRLVLGPEGSRELPEVDQRVVPAKLLALDHEFRFGELELSLSHQLGR